MTDQEPFSEWIGVGPEKYNAVFKAIETGEIQRYDEPRLLEAARILAAFHSHHVGQDQTAAALLIHNLQIAHTMKAIESSNRRLQVFVTILAVVALVVGVLQTYFTVFPRIAIAEKPLIATQKSSVPTATEVFSLRSRCEELAQKIEDENLVGSALAQSHRSHYDPATNRCYVELNVHSADLDKFEDNNSRYLYDGQTHELLAWIKNQHGKKTFHADGIWSEEGVEARFEALMSDDRK
jgi:hypothetical protein